MINKDSILQTVGKLATTTVSVPEWGGDVLVSTLTGEQRDELESMFQRGPDGRIKTANVRARIAAMVLVDEDGNYLFSESDIERLGKTSATALDRVFEAAMAHNRITGDDAEALAGN